MKALFRWLRSPQAVPVLLALMLAFILLGTRGIWDPDEGRYTNVALNMLRNGDWINPHRHHEVGHWTKPPLTYWAIAASVAAFGRNAWAARLPSALAYLLCVAMVWRIARRLLPGRETLAATIYATMLLTVAAAQMITTDYVLAAATTLTMWAYAEARFGPQPPGRERRWIALMWVGVALAFMTKGPPGLLPLLAVLGNDLWQRGHGRHRTLRLSGVVLFAALALPWYLAVIHGNPRLFRYFIHDEVINRIATDEFDRNPQWYGWLTVYAPTLLLGTLPWTPVLLRWARALPGTLKRWWRVPDARLREAPAVLLTLWLLLPLLVLCLARSRLPLYLLPSFAPLALLAAWQWHGEGRASPRRRWLLAWVAILLGLRIAWAFWPTHKDAALWAGEIRARAGAPVREVVFVDDMARYGLHVELGAEVEKVSLAPQAAASRFNPEYDSDLLQELSEHETGVVWVAKQTLWPELQQRIAGQGYAATALGKPYRDRIIFRVFRTSPAPSLSTPADRDAR